MSNGLTKTSLGSFYEIDSNVRRKYKKELELIAVYFGNLSLVAKVLGIPYHRLNAICVIPEVKRYVNECKQQLLDLTEEKLTAMLQNSDNDPNMQLRVIETIMKFIGRPRYGADSQTIIQQQINTANEKVEIRNIFGIPDTDAENT